MMGESEVQGVDNYWFANDRSVDVIRGSVNEVAMREGVGGGHLSTREDFPNYIKVLKEEGPVSLASRQCARVFYIGETFVGSDDGDRMRGFLDVLFPFLQCKDYGKEFTIIDVIVSFSRDKCLGEIGAWM